MNRRDAEPTSPFRIALAMLLLLPALAAALESDRRQPMEVEADDGNVLLTDDGNAVLSGNVRITQGTLVIEADRATVEKKAGEFSRTLFEGQPATLQQQLDSGGTTKIRARRIDYDMGAGVVVLTGDVSVQQPEGEMRGERIRYDLNTEQLESGAPGSRIRMTLAPRPSSTPKSD